MIWRKIGGNQEEPQPPTCWRDFAIRRSRTEGGTTEKRVFPPVNGASRRWRTDGPKGPSIAAVRGQILISDLIISMAVFLLLIAIAYEAYNRQTDRLGEWHARVSADDAMQRGLAAITDAQGNPTNWAAAGYDPSQAAVLSLGAAEGRGRIDAFKLGRLAAFFNDSAYYNATRLKMGLGYFDADVRVSGLDGTNISAMGSPPTSSSVVLSAGTRLAAYGNRTVLVRLRVWKNE